MQKSPFPGIICVAETRGISDSTLETMVESCDLVHCASAYCWNQISEVGYPWKPQENELCVYSGPLQGWEPLQFTWRQGLFC